MRLVLACLVLLIASAAQAQFTKAELIFFRSNDGKTSYDPPHIIRLTESSVAKLVANLKGLGAPKGALKPAGWKAWATITLYKGGRGIKIFVPYEADRWSQLGRQGDYVAAPGFREYLIGLDKPAK